MKYFCYIGLIVLSFSVFADSLERILSKDFSYLMHMEDMSGFSSRDKAFVLKCKNQYEKNKHRLLQNFADSKIPKIIHFIWLGPKNFPKESIKNIRSWIENHQDWEVWFWTDRQRPAPCSEMKIVYVEDFSFQHLQEDFLKAINWGEKSDILRYEILYRHGGVYADHDTICKRPLDILHRAYDFYVCASASHTSIDGYSFALIISPIGTTANHPILLEALYQTKNLRERAVRIYGENNSCDLRRKVMHSTYIALTKAFDKKEEEDHFVNMVFPPVFFYGDPRYEALFIEQYCAGSWIVAVQDKQECREIRKGLSHLRSWIYPIGFLQMTGLLLLAIIIREKR